MIKRSFRICLFVIFAVLMKSCGEPRPVVKYSHPGWDTLHFAGWSMQVPEGFEVQIKGGAESHSGNIISVQDSLDIHFDVWTEAGADYEDCSSHILEQNTESSFDWCEEFYHAGSEHRVWRDTVNGRYAVLSKPLKTGHGTLSIHFSECHHSLAMSTFDLTKEQEELVLEMFATIDWTEGGTEH